MIEPQIIYEDENILAVGKPSGLLVHKTSYSKEFTLVDWLVQKYPEIKNVGENLDIRPGIVHRLDKDTSGIMLVARNQKTFEKLKNMFKNHKIKKTYLALVWGIPKEKEKIINLDIGLRGGTIKRTIYNSKYKKKALTYYKVLKSFKDKFNQDISLLEIHPQTGRTHQIRVHLKSIGHPICGDKLYGKKNDDFSRLMLHSLSVEFGLENGKILKLEAEPPQEFKI